MRDEVKLLIERCWTASLTKKQTKETVLRELKVVVTTAQLDGQWQSLKSKYGGDQDYCRWKGTIGPGALLRHLIGREND